MTHWLEQQAIDLYVDEIQKMALGYDKILMMKRRFISGFHVKIKLFKTMALFFFHIKTVFILNFRLVYMT